MSVPHGDRPDLPEFMTWEELGELPEEIAGQVELWDGRVVWMLRGPAEHQTFTNRIWAALEQCIRRHRSDNPDRCLRVTTETNVFLGTSGKNDFLTPDFLVHRCLHKPYQDLRAGDVLLVGEVLSPGNTQTDIEAKKARYASAGIPWYWEAALDRSASAIASIRAYGLDSDPGPLPDGVRPLRQANYLLAGEWIPADDDGIRIKAPFPIAVDWAALAY